MHKELTFNLIYNIY